MKLPPRMPQGAMVRIWGASLHQKNQRRNYAGFCFARHLKSHSRGWIRTAAATSLKMAQKQPGGLFLAARLATSTRAHQKTSTYASTLRFLFCDKAKLIGRVDPNSCGTVQQDDLQQCKDQQNNKNRSNHRVPCIIIFCNGIQVGTLCNDFFNFSKNH